MKKEFVPYKQALELKELGFDEPCFAVYIDKTLIIEDDWLYSTNQDTFIESSNFTAPLYQQAFRWFREKYGIMYTVDNNIVGNTYHGSYTKINSDYESDYTNDFATYEEAELECLKKLIETVKNK
jgi:hypothetical protein